MKVSLFKWLAHWVIRAHRKRQFKKGVLMASAKKTQTLGRRPLVYRPDPGESLGGLVTKALMREATERSKLYVEQSALQVAALGPVRKLIRANAGAAEAASRLSKVSQQLAHGHRIVRSPQPPPGPVTIPTGLWFFAPPYDHAEITSDVSSDPDIPQPVNSVDVLTGTVHLWAWPDFSYDGGFSANAGLAIDLATSQDGTLTLRSLAHVSWGGGTDGFILSAEVEGHVTMTVLDTTTQTQVVAPGDYQVFQLTNGSNSGFTTVSGDEASVQFAAQAGTPYQVWITASISGNQSGDGYAFGYSFADGYIDMTVPLVVADLS